MAKSFLGGRKSIRIRTGQIYVLRDGEGVYASVGDIESAALSMNVETNDVFKPFRGARVKAKTFTQEVGGELSLTLLSTTARNLAIALQGEEQEFLQTAQTGLSLSGTDAIPGQLVDLGGIRAENVSVTTDGTTALVADIDYELNTETGTLVWLTAQPNWQVDFDLAEVVSSDGVEAVSMLTNAEGVRGTVMIVGEDDEGNSWKMLDVPVELRASGDVNLVSSEVSKIELTGSLVKGPNPSYPFGRSIEIPAAA